MKKAKAQQPLAAPEVQKLEAELKRINYKSRFRRVLR